MTLQFGATNGLIALSDEKSDLTKVLAALMTEEEDQTPSMTA